MLTPDTSNAFSARLIIASIIWGFINSQNSRDHDYVTTLLQVKLVNNKSNVNYHFQQNLPS